MDIDRWTQRERSQREIERDTQVKTRKEEWTERQTDIEAEIQGQGNMSFDHSIMNNNDRVGSKKMEKL